MRPLACAGGVLAGIALALTAGAAPQPASPVGELAYYEREVRPILTSRCLGCHSGKSEKPGGGLRLDQRNAWLKGGESGPALVPGDPEKSLLLRAVRYRDTSLRMPPAGKLPDREIAVLTEWIRRGAPAPAEVPSSGFRVPSKGSPGSELETRNSQLASSHWSLRPLRRPAVPAVRQKAWVKTPVDAFVLAALEKRGLKPSPPADRRTLIRRITYDLTGLPPTPEEVEAFLEDRSLNAWEKVVDRLLASPRYGERWGRHWLDVVHYGDTHGYDKDKRRNHAWPYRDYVIRSFNQDKPYDRFIREQIAGDVLYPQDPDGIVATGFVAAGPWDFVGHVELKEGTVEKEKTRLLDRDDMVSNTMSTFTSLTVHCARCHDHKFDPIPQRDYYRLQAVFAGVERGDRSYPDPERLRLGTRLQALRSRLEALMKQAASRDAAVVQAQDRRLAELTGRLGALPPLPAGSPSPTNGYHSAIESRPEVEKWVQVDLGRTQALEEIRLLPARPTDFRDTPGFGFPRRFRVAVSEEPDFLNATVVADHTSADFPNPGVKPVVIPVSGRKARFVRVTAQRLWPRTNDYVFALAELQVMAGNQNVAGTATVTSLDSIEAGRWSRRYLVDNCDSRHHLPDAADPAVAARLREEAQLRRAVSAREGERERLVRSLLTPAEREEVQRLEAEELETDKRLAALPPARQVYAVLPRAPRPVHVLARGDVERPREPAPPGALSCLPSLPAQFSLPNPTEEGQRRAALAQWIADPRNPLTWRSIVNRVWHYHFGRGLVDTPNDFGKMGSPPSHPELLDWLAFQFTSTSTANPTQGGKGDGGKGTGQLTTDNSQLSIVNSSHRHPHKALGRSLKKLHRLLLLSAVYQQSSRNQPAPAKIDGENRLLWRMNRQRLDAESVRDSVLAVSGKLDLTMGGPAFELFRFKDDHSPIYDYSALEKAEDPATWRRTVYRFTVRSVPNPFLDSLDCADPNINTPVRNTTLTALQALALLNDPFMVAQSEHLAARLRREAPDLERQIDLAYRLVLSRPPQPEERAALAAYARKHGLPNACRLLLNTNEFAFID